MLYESIQFVTFLRGCPGTPMLGPAVNRQPGFRRGLVEQSNVEKNNPVGWLSGWLAGYWLELAVSAGSGCLAAWLVLAD